MSLKVVQWHESFRAWRLLQGSSHVNQVSGQEWPHLVSRKGLPIPHHNSVPQMPVSIKKSQLASETDFRGWRRMTLGQKLVTGSVKGDEKVAGDVKKEMLQREQRDGTRIEE